MNAYKACSRNVVRGMSFHNAEKNGGKELRLTRATLSQVLRPYLQLLAMIH